MTGDCSVSILISYLRMYLAFIVRNLSQQMKISLIKIIIVVFIKSNKNSLFYQNDENWRFFLLN